MCVYLHVWLSMFTEMSQSFEQRNVKRREKESAFFVIQRPIFA